MADQEQRGGMGSTNIQIQTVTTGLNYSDVRDIARDVFEQNFDRLVNVAKETANIRAAEIREDIVNEISKKSRIDLDKFSHPEKQIALLDAQRAYALSGDALLKDMLINSVISISREEERSLKSIVLQEALKIIPTLTVGQIIVLTSSFLVRYYRHNYACTLSLFAENMNSYLGLKGNLIDPKDGDFRHIEYSRCGSVAVTEIGFDDIMRGNYPGLFSKGLAIEDIVNGFGIEGIPDGVIIPCMNDNTRFQIAFLGGTDVEQISKDRGWSEHQRAIILSKLSENLMSNEKIGKQLAKVGGSLPHLRAIWDRTKLKNLQLTSVGLAVAHSYICAQGVNIHNLDNWV